VRVAEGYAWKGKDKERKTKGDNEKGVRQESLGKTV